MTATAPTSIEELDSPSSVLVFARARRADADRAEADVLTAAVIWAEQHPPESIDDAATWLAAGCGDTGLPLAGPGAPLVAEFCIAEFALALGRSTDSGRALIADAVELKYRLPKVWARIRSGALQAWRARRVAQATLGLSMEAARFVDTQVAAFAHKIGVAALDRLVAEAIARFMPDLAAENAEKAAEGRHFTIHHDQVSFTGTSRIEGELDLADALDLDDALARGAESLRAGGSTDSLDVRRSMAAGELARHQLALDLNTDPNTDPEADGVPTGPTAAGRSTSRRAKPAAGGALRAPLRGSHHRQQRLPGPGPGGEPTPGPHRRPGPRLVRQPRHRGGREAGDRPGREPRGRGLRGPRPARRTDHPGQPHLRVSLVHQASQRLRQGPRQRPRGRRLDEHRQHRTPV